MDEMIDKGDQDQLPHSILIFNFNPVDSYV